jgi:cyclophilin family peptidyl-prolyl cis-trans isomerase
MPSEKRQRQDEGRLNRRLAEHTQTKRQRRVRSARNLVIVAVVALAAVFLYSVVAGDDGDDTVDTASSSTTLDPTNTSSTVPGAPEAFAYGTGACAAADGSSPRTVDFESAPQQCIDTAKTYTAVVETTEGKVTVALDTQATPGATNNFVNLARFHYYDATDLFRTNTGIGIIQGGGPHTQDNSDPGPGYTIPDEGFSDDVVTAGSGGPYRYTAGDVVYARPGSTPDSSSAQFFLCATDACSGLDSQGIYIRFGKVTEGQDVLESILASSPDGEGRPTKDTKVTKVTITES